LKGFYKKIKINGFDTRTGELLDGKEVLIPTDWQTEEHLTKKWEFDKTYEVEQKKARNSEFHKKYMALVRFALINLHERYSRIISDFDSLRNIIKMETRHVDYVWTLPSKTIVFDRDLFVLNVSSKSAHTSEEVIKIADESYSSKEESKVLMIPRSIAFNKMKQDEFEAFYNKTVDIVTLLIRTDKQTLLDELDEFRGE